MYNQHLNMSKWLNVVIVVLSLILVVNTITLIIVAIFDDQYSVRYSIILAISGSLEVIIIFTLTILTMMSVFQDVKFESKFAWKQKKNFKTFSKNPEARSTDVRRNFQTIYNNINSKWANLQNNNGVSYKKPNTKTLYKNAYSNWANKEFDQKNSEYGVPDLKLNSEAQYENTYSDWATLEYNHKQFIVMKEL